VRRSLGLLALVAMAILALVAVIGVTRPVRVQPSPPGSAPEPTAAPQATSDAGSLDSVLDGIHVEHAIKHGR
jgi:hypothetical protein